MNDCECCSPAQVHEGEAGEERDPPPRIYVASLSDYNAGRLHGCWIDADLDPEEIEARVKDMLAESTEPIAEEWAIHDSEGFGGVKIDEWESFETVSAIAERIEKHGEVFVGVYDHCGGNLEECDEAFDEHDAGEWTNLEEWAENLLEDTGELNNLSEKLRPYFDYSAYARDCELGGDIWTVEVGRRVHVFWSF